MKVESNGKTYDIFQVNLNGVVMPIEEFLLYHVGNNPEKVFKGTDIERIRKENDRKLVIDKKM